MSAKFLTRAWRASLIIIGWMFGAAIATAADAPPLILEHLSTAEGLPQATVMTTLQDSQGFVWLGTEDGLVRYDGHRLHRYAAARGEQGTLSGNYIWDIAEDAGGDLWIAVRDRGVARWHRKTDTFTQYRHDPNNPASLASDNVRAILLDSRGQLWIGTSDAGVAILDPASGRIRQLRHTGAAGSLSSDRIFALSLARSGDVWIGTESGLDRWSLADDSIASFGPAAGTEGSLLGKQISHILEDKSGAVWVGSFEVGLTRLDRDGRLLEVFRHRRDANSLGSDDVRAVLEDRSGRLWVGTGDGLELLDRASGHFTHFRHDDRNPDSLRDSFVMSLYEDQEGLVWIGTRTGGVSRWNPRSWEFGGQRPKWLGSGPVNAFADAPDGRVWIASLDGGLRQFDPHTNEMTPLDALVKDHQALRDDKVMSLRQDHLGTLWIGTMNGGLKKLTAEGRIDSIAVKPGDPRATSAAGIMTVVESRSGQIWIGTFGGGANVLDPATGAIRQLPFGGTQPGATSSAEVTAIAEDSRGNFWIGTMNGLNLARADGYVLRVFQNEPKDPTSLPANSVYAVLVDAQDRVWVATEGGLSQIDGAVNAPEKIRFKTFTREQGLSGDTLYGIVPDDAGSLWLSGNAGLMRFDPASGAIKAYHREHGLQGEEFAFGAYFRLRDGRVCFGGPGGFNIFDPTKLTENRQPPRLALTNIDVLGVRMVSKTPFWLLHTVPLSYRDSIVSLDFGVLDFGSTQHNRLAYRMPGLSEDWIDLGSQRRITLTTLPAGEHLLEVRAASSDSVWSKEPMRITIDRAPAPWQSRWAYAAYAALILGVILYRAREQRRKFQAVVEQRAQLETEVQLRTRELVESNRQLAEAAQAKSNFLDRMSHELRTPMNGVVGMTELLTRTQLSATQSHLTKTIRSSAQILLQIVNDLLDLSKIRAGKVALESLPIDLGQVLEECTSLFAGAAESKGIELIVCPPTYSEQVLLGDPLRVRQIVMNLVGNAVKFTSQGEVVVRADVAVADGRATARISVTDTGIGMDAAAVKRIFEPFSQADETTTRKFGGTGLGLAICRELSDIMGGQITVESTPQIGSTFHLSLPLSIATTPMTEEAKFPGRTLRILTRRSSLRESLSRHALALGLTPVDGSSATQPAAGEIVMLDASTYPDDLKHVLAAQTAWPGLIVIATNAEVETYNLRALLNEKTIVLKPVHRISLREALAVVTGLAVGSESNSLATDTPTLKGHVLLVEDEPVNAAVAEGYLATLGCTSVWVKSGTEAVARSAGEHFDLILMDLNMPDMDGFAATKLIRQRAGQGKRTPIVALTAHDAATYRDKCLNADMDDILTKPYTMDECSRLLRKWLAQEAEVAAPVAKPVATPAKHGLLASVDAAAVASLRKLRAGGHTDLYSKLVDLFRTGSVESLAQLCEAMTAKDLAAAASICHKLASSASNVGALAYGKELRRLEQLCVAGEYEQAVAVHESIKGAHAPLLDALLGLTMRASA
ncbi:hybrid sensor histidine kinase/response regulator [Steroidobacter sp.]|uniref:hybrid sensor histidine kinase/response regulator n=1 Tax=Steroidobacter sp. TaxID=1978227 RepID=UPI001A423DE0|nr:hybrid sensor histidine kinase/response regulator [Steroidobacter sp.]MBL8270687.1 response regulator [Steroidobacter sp.]